MLIKLIPEPPHPSVLFAITFTNAPFAYSPDKPNASLPEEVFSDASLLMSAGWAHQLNTLALDDIELPTSLHALDRAAGIPTLIQEVTLDVPSCTVRCSFMDGSVEEWAWPSKSQFPVPTSRRPIALRGAADMQQYTEMLASVVRDVNQSAVEDELDRQKELYSFAQMQSENPERQSSESQASRPVSPKPTLKTHKKQRSFFMNIVASIVNLTPSAMHLHPRPPLPPSPKRSPPASIHISFSSPPTPTCLRSPFPPLWSPPNSPIRQTLRSVEPPASAARMLRWHARSTLVDAFRRFVLPEILSRTSYGSYRNYHAINFGFCGTDGNGKVGAGYYVCAIESMLRRAGQRMDELANMAMATPAGTEKGKERKIRTRIFPRFTVPRRKSVQLPESVNQSPTHYNRSAETRAERERERREAEYFASTTQSIPSPHLFSDEEDSTEEGLNAARQRKRSGDSSSNGDDDSDTDTDGSSVHTPSSEYGSFIFSPPPNKPLRQSKLPLLVSPRHTRSVSRIVSPMSSASIQTKGTLVADGPPPGSLSPTEVAEYKSLSRLMGKLQHILFSARARASQAEYEARQRDATLEVRSRRRAWLNRGLRSGSSASSIESSNCTFGYISTCTMSTPTRSSPLARCMWTSEDWDYVPDICVDEEDDDDIILQERARFSVGDESDHVVYGYPLRRGRESIGKGEAMLFPVIEEDEDSSSDANRGSDTDEETLIGTGIGDDDELRELEHQLAGFNLDVEAGEKAWADNDDQSPHGEDGINSSGDGACPNIRMVIETERPRVRVRTSSMYEHKSPFGALNLSTDRKTSPDSSSPPSLTASSLLCQPLTTGNLSGSDHNPSPAVLVSPLPEKSETPMICASFAGEIRDSDEFTLSMDLPPPMKGRNHISTFSTVPAAQSLTIFAPTTQGGRQVQLSTVPDAR